MTRLADSLRSIGNLDDAEKFYKKALNIDYDYYAALGLALISKERNDYNKAIESLSRMYDMDKTNARLVYELAACYKLNKEYEKGMTIIKKYIESGYSNNMVTELYEELKKIMD
jgi:tetratricopeptide (TPR) repeat protein